MLRAAMIAASVLAIPTVGAAQDLRAQGEKVYATQKCSLCHAVEGKGNTKGPLDDVGSRLSADDIRAWIVDAKGMTAKTKASRKPEMRAYSLPKEDVDALVAYLTSLKKK
jgi:mono/diheme cytochrome c family protein